MNPRLIPDQRVCCSCGSAARVRHGFMPIDPDEPEIVAITPVVYVSGTGGNVKGQVKNAPKIQICSKCLVLAVGGTSSILSAEARSLFAALRNSLALRYSVMLREGGA